MNPVVTVDQVRAYLSSPPWSGAQEAACALLILQRQRELQNYLNCPIDPQARTELVAILESGLLVTTWPVFQLLAIDTTTLSPGAFYGQPLPTPYTWRDEGWVTAPPLAAGGALMSRPYSLLAGDTAPTKVATTYLGGWGPQPDLTGAIIQKVAAVMLNRHDDTVTARALDTKAPPPLKEEWTPGELKALSYRRRPRGGMHPTPLGSGW
jgi:hypothetical protein